VCGTDFAAFLADGFDFGTTVSGGPVVCGDTGGVGQYFGTEPSAESASRILVGTDPWPRDASVCASLILRSSWEPRPDNADENATAGSGSTPWGGESLNSYWEAFVDRVATVAGQFTTGTTTEIFSWAAARWGIDEDLLRAVAVQESDWHMSALGDVCGPPGQASYGITQIKNAYCNGVTAWGGYPDTTLSTALNLDFYGCYIRTAFDGYFYDGGPYLYGGQTVAEVAADHDWEYVLWGCVGSWFSGGWYDALALPYIALVQGNLAAREWESYSPPAYTPPTTSGGAATFGVTTQGAHTNLIGTDRLHLCGTFEPDQSGTLVSFSAWLEGLNAPPQSCKFALYTNTAGPYPDTLVDGSVSLAQLVPTLTPMTRYTVACTGEPTVTSGVSYWIAVITDDVDNQVQIAYDSGGDLKFGAWTYTDGFPATLPAGFSDLDYLYSISANYTVGGTAGGSVSGGDRPTV
jgi:autotransporter family porin